jgi:enoyl-CoA hydratase/carnithine racemase
MRCDVAVASDQARFILDEVKLGIPPMFLMEAMVDHLPPKRALDIILTSRECAANEALEMGLLSRTVPDAQLDTAVRTLTAELRARDPRVLLASKHYLKTFMNLPAGARSAFAIVEQTRFAAGR